MQVEGTKEAFAKMISERGVYKRLGVDVTTVSNWKIYLRQGKSISLDKMEEMLIRGGATVVQEKIWDIAEPSYAPVITTPPIKISVDSVRSTKPKGKTIIVKK
jgi:hypothetical protein